MRDKYIIIDDFYSDPNSVLKLVKDLPKQYSDNNWAGQMTDISLFSEEIRQFMSYTLGQEVDSGTSLNGRFRFSMEMDSFKQDIHFDPAVGVEWAGVVYLTPDEHVKDKQSAGTQFWKHKERGLVNVPLTKEGNDEQGWTTIEEMKHFLDTDGMDRSKWDLEMSIPWKFNRLVLFRPWLFHSPGLPFGDTIDNCRTVQTFFLRRRTDE